jgi:hypothetical protein
MHTDTRMYVKKNFNYFLTKYDSFVEALLKEKIS